MSVDKRIILVIYQDYAQCSGCGGGADWAATAHDQPKSWKTPNRACGGTFTHVATEESGPLGRQWRNKRPDLEYVGAGWLMGDGTEFVLDIPPQHAFRKDAYKYSVRSS
jgi:hypothetical protein